MKDQAAQLIFIVDDDPFWTALLQQILTDLGFTNINCLNSGEECIQNLHADPQLIFLDYQMNTIDGLEVLKQIRTNSPEKSVIFCTSLEDISVAVSAMKYGSLNYLLKSNANRKEVARMIQGITHRQTLFI